MISKEDYDKFINDECVQRTMVTVHEEDEGGNYFSRYRLWRKTSPMHIEMEVILLLRGQGYFRRLVSVSSEDVSYNSVLKLHRKILNSFKIGIIWEG